MKSTPLPDAADSAFSAARLILLLGLFILVSFPDIVLGSHAFVYSAALSGRCRFGVRLVYRDTLFQAGAILSLLSLALCALGAWRGTVKWKRVPFCKTLSTQTSPPCA